MTYASFESKGNIKNALCGFDIKAKRFSPTKSKYVGGVPLMYDSENGTVYIDPTDTHTLVFGATGSLKSRAVVMPTIRILGYAGESMIINDSKGELYAKLAYELKHKHGYKLITINLRNPALSNAWNPFKIPYEFYLNGDTDRAAEFASDIANNLMMEGLSLKEPFWDYASADLFFGLILLLFKYCKTYNQPTEAVNIGNILKLRQTIFSSNRYTDDPWNSEIWKFAMQDELITSCMSGSIYAPPTTRRSILSVFDQKVRAFSIQPTLLNMLSDNNFDLADVAHEKTAIFLITPDEKTLYHRLVALFVKQAYEYIIFNAQKNPAGKVENRINFILDEYSSLPKIHDMSAMISAARSRDIRFLLIVQSKKQLIQKYEEEADTIISNCTNWIFLTSRETTLLKEISDLCGDLSNGKPLVSVFDLQHFSKPKYEALVLAGRLKPIIIQLLDIDKYDEEDYPVLEFEKLPRKDRIILSFNMDKKPITPPSSIDREDKKIHRYSQTQKDLDQHRREDWERRKAEILARMQAQLKENEEEEEEEEDDTIIDDTTYDKEDKDSISQSDSDDNEKLRLAREALERRKAAILARMQAQLKEEEEEKEKKEEDNTTDENAILEEERVNDMHPSDSDEDDSLELISAQARKDLKHHGSVTLKVLQAQLKKEHGSNTTDHNNDNAKVILSSDKKVSPNDPCPCGSGKKYKNCCGKPQAK